MDVHSFNGTEKEAVVRAMVYLARIDGELSPEESSFMQTMARELGVDPVDCLDGAEGLSLEEMLRPVTRPSKRRAVVIELLRLAHADNRFLPEEVVGIQDIARVFEIDRETLDIIKDYVLKDIEWRKVGQALVDRGADAKVTEAVRSLRKPACGW